MGQAQRHAAPEGVAEYIEDMLAELATMAEGIGQTDLAMRLRLTAIEAARLSPISSE